jgi:hypothetical protein
VLVAGGGAGAGEGSEETSLLHFDRDGGLLEIRPGFPLPESRMGVALIDGGIVAVGDTFLATAALDGARLEPFIVTRHGVRRPNGTGPLVVTERATFNTPGGTTGGAGRAVFRADRSAQSVGPYIASSAPGAFRHSPEALRWRKTLFLIGGETRASDEDELVVSRIIEGAVFDDAGALGPFARRGELPEPLDEPASLIADDGLYLCGGYTRAGRQSPSDRCVQGAVDDAGQIGDFIDLPRLPIPCVRGALVKVRRHLLLVGASCGAIEPGAAIFDLPLDELRVGWRRLPLDLPRPRLLDDGVVLLP